MKKKKVTKKLAEKCHKGLRHDVVETAMKYGMEGMPRPYIALMLTEAAMYILYTKDFDAKKTRDTLVKCVETNLRKLHDLPIEEKPPREFTDF